MIALVSVIAVAAIVATAIIARRTTITVIIVKDQDMATIKERLTALEAAVAQSADAATAAEVSALTERVTTIEAEIGTDPAPSADAPGVATDSTLTA